MNRDDIIRMARDSGMELYGLGKDREKFVHYLQEFTALVAAAEREACARVCADMQNGWASDDHLACADAIRARGEK